MVSLGLPLATELSETKSMLASFSQSQTRPHMKQSPLDLEQSPIDPSHIYSTLDLTQTSLFPRDCLSLVSTICDHPVRLLTLYTLQF